MRDWGELWLNEGFASYFENLAATIARPNFAYFETFYPDFTASALAVDAMPKSTHPLATLTGTVQPRSYCWNPPIAMGPCSLPWTSKASVLHVVWWPIVVASYLSLHFTCQVCSRTWEPRWLSDDRRQAMTPPGCRNGYL